MYLVSISGSNLPRNTQSHNRSQWVDPRGQNSSEYITRYIHEHWHFICNKSGAWYIFRFEQEYIRTVLQFKRNGTETSRYVAWTKRGSGYLFSARDGYCHFQQQFGPLFRRPPGIKGNGNSLRLRYSPARGYIPWRIWTSRFYDIQSIWVKDNRNMEFATFVAFECPISKATECVETIVIEVKSLPILSGLKLTSDFHMLSNTMHPRLGKTPYQSCTTILFIWWYYSDFILVRFVVGALQWFATIDKNQYDTRKEFFRWSMYLPVTGSRFISHACLGGFSPSFLLAGSDHLYKWYI